MTNTDPTGRFPGDATPDEIRLAVDALKLSARHDGVKDWERVAWVARWIADAAGWQSRDSKAEATAAKPWLAECYDDTTIAGA
ncbi:hypothetical protein ACH4YO_40695 [Streptomyces noursei]|uniref:hypothetical protein n=1 Tax=Streptomyces noursei TaxID=1971 RepID=UPI00081CE2B3|nr:hypothetical protein SNOUR_00035 [Streptomyces noursei ATCC 11455]ANZ22005.1 hypothetical protein SNOUR_43915 [Streptomyces noursei ATCC 11455]MCZ0996413.1 hypothetical protein [Streptomyces noursei]